MGAFPKEPWVVEPWHHQMKEYAKHRNTPARALLWQMRTGKSRAVIDKACHLWLACEVDALLIVAPNSVHANWCLRELPKHCWPKVNYTYAYWVSGDKDEEARCQGLLEVDPMGMYGLKVLAVNNEALLLDRVKKLLVKYTKMHKVFVVYDESHHFARPGARYTGVARQLARRCHYREILTGTSVENSPLQAFSQYELLEKGALGHETYAAFKEEFADIQQFSRGRPVAKGTRPKGRVYERVVGYRNMDVLKERMAKYSSVVLRSDCEDLPPVQVDQRVVLMTEEQVEWLSKVKRKDLDFLEERGVYDPLTGGAVLTKLQQISSGFFKRPNGGADLVMPADKNPKMLALLDELQQYNKQAIVWCMYLNEIQLVETVLGAQGIPFTTIYGAVSTAERAMRLNAFRAGKAKVLVGQPKAIGEGQDISAAGMIVWVSQTPDAILRQQANERATAMGKDSVQIVDLVPPRSVDGYYLGLTGEKIELADDVSRRGMTTILEKIGE